MSVDSATVESMLGVSHRADTPFPLVTAVEAGLPVSALRRVARTVAPDDAAFVYRLVPKATLARRQGAGKGGRLSAEESARLARLAKVWAFAKTVWKTDAGTRNFMFGPHMLLQMRRPIDLVLGSEFGAEAVENVIGGLLYSVAV